MDVYMERLGSFTDATQRRLVRAEGSIASKLHAPQASAPPIPATAQQGTGTLSTHHLPRLEQLKFSGQIEHFVEFKRNWLSRFGRLDNNTQLQYLKPSLPAKDQARVAAVSSMEECWHRLGKVYGDRTCNVITVKSNLKAFI